MACVSLHDHNLLMARVIRLERLVGNMAGTGDSLGEREKTSHELYAYKFYLRLMIDAVQRYRKIGDSVPGLFEAIHLSGYPA